MRKTGRGRLSTIDQLPVEAKPLVAAAMADLRARQKPQTVILDELNAGLADLDIGSISKSAFSRKSIWVMTHGRDLEETREIAAIMGEKLSKVPEGDVGLLLNETIKNMIFELISERNLSDDGDTAELIAICARSLNNLERARHLNVATANKIRTNFADTANKAIDHVAKEKGLTGDTVKAIKAKILGIREGAADV